MFNNKNRLFNPNNQYQQPYMNYDYNGYNQYDLFRFDEQINELKRMNNELLKRINRLENYLGIRAESDASNYQ
jgi:hypothetical protein